MKICRQFYRAAKRGNELKAAIFFGMSRRQLTSCRRWGRRMLRDDQRDGDLIKLRRGGESITLSDSDFEPFFNALMDYHAGRTVAMETALGF